VRLTALRAMGLHRARRGVAPQPEVKRYTVWYRAWRGERWASGRCGWWRPAWSATRRCPPGIGWCSRSQHY